MNSWILDSLETQEWLYFLWGGPNLQWVLQAYKDESHIWQFSGPKGLAALDPSRVVAQA